MTSPRPSPTAVLIPATIAETLASLRAQGDSLRRVSAVCVAAGGAAAHAHAAG